MYLAKMDFKNVIFHLYLEKWLLRDVWWFRRELGGCQASISCNKWVLGAEESLMVIHSHWQNPLLHCDSEIGKWMRVTSKLSGDFFKLHIIFFLYTHFKSSLRLSWLPALISPFCPDLSENYTPFSIFFLTPLWEWPLLCFHNLQNDQTVNHLWFMQECRVVCWLYIELKQFNYIVWNKICHCN